MADQQLRAAIGWLVAGNGLAMVSDVIIKAQAADLPVFQFIFLRTVITLLVLLPFWSALDHRHFLRGFRIHLLRSHIGLLCIACTIVALGSLPLATANAIFFSAPLWVVLLAVTFASERLRRIDLVAVVSGFLGVLVILRPIGLNASALSAFAVALSLAVSALLVRWLPPGQSKVHALVLNGLLMLPTTLALACWEDAPWRSDVLITALGSAVFILGYNFTVLYAYSSAHASRVTSAEYTGLLWAAVFGWLFFAEAPDFWMLGGAVMICVPLLISHRKLRVPIREMPINPP
jgi:drug/metabolite transporter (DMT)-like permease